MNEDGKQYLSVVIEYEDGDEMPRLGRDQLLGGRVCGMAWNNVLNELQTKEERISILEEVINQHGLDDEVEAVAEEWKEMF